MQANEAFDVGFRAANAGLAKLSSLHLVMGLLYQEQD